MSHIRNIECSIADQTNRLDQDAIKKFQEGKLNPNDEEWHRLVDPEARNALPKKEVNRQSVLFEVIKSEKDYVEDLEIMRDVGAFSHCRDSTDSWHRRSSSNL